MNVEAFRTYCLQKKHVTESFPFDQSTLVFKVAGKMFALTGLDKKPFTVNLKCNPEKALELRELHESTIIPGWHMNKKHWNTVTFEGDLPQDLLVELVDHSYNLVVQSLTKKAQKEFGFTV